MSTEEAGGLETTKKYQSTLSDLLNFSPDRPIISTWPNFDDGRELRVLLTLPDRDNIPVNHMDVLVQAVEDLLKYVKKERDEQPLHEVDFKAGDRVKISYKREGLLKSHHYEGKEGTVVSVHPFPKEHVGVSKAIINVTLDGREKPYGFSDNNVEKIDAA